jgi:hypothetical protein
MHSTLKPACTNNDWSLRNPALLFVLTAFAFLIMGYHPGLEDDAFYLAAIKRDLNPALFPHDSQFFTIQFQATIFDKLIAFSTRLSHLPVAWMTLLWQFAAIFFILHGCQRIARRCFREPTAQWAAVAMVAVLLTLPVSGTGISLADQYLHPRNLATAAILAAIVAVLDRRPWLAAVLLAVAVAIHAIMAAFGISLCIFLWWNLRQNTSPERTPAALSRTNASSVFALFPLPWKGVLLAASAFPFGWIFAPSSDAWRKAASTRGFYYLSEWPWYEWLGVFAPLALLYLYRFWVAQRFKRCDEAGQKNGALAPEDSQLFSLVSSLLFYGVFQTVVGLAIMLPPRLERLRPFEPMRYLQLVYLLFFLFAGALLGRYVLSSTDLRHPERSRSSGEARDLARTVTAARDLPIRTRAYRWLLLFIPLAAGMFYAQRQLYPASSHIEWPESAAKAASSANPWLAAFAWIRENTPLDALFALDPHYMQLPEEDYHGFRALAERSVLADYDKDGGMAARVPSLAPRWLKEVTAQTGWRNFEPADFERLRNEFGVNWIILSRADDLGPEKHVSPSLGMTCPYQNQQLRICRLY